MYLSYATGDITILSVYIARKSKPCGFHVRFDSLQLGRSVFETRVATLVKARG